MQIEKKKNYTLINSDEIPFKEFYKEYEKEIKNTEKENIIIVFSNKVDYTKEDFFVFLDIAEEKKKNGTSFVIVYSKVNIDDFPESFNITPTLTEAEDIIEMEAIEKELGF